MKHHPVPSPRHRRSRRPEDRFQCRRRHSSIPINLQPSGPRQLPDPHRRPVWQRIRPHIHHESIPPTERQAPATRIQGIKPRIRRTKRIPRMTHHQRRQLRDLRRHHHPEPTFIRPIRHHRHRHAALHGDLGQCRRPHTQHTQHGNRRNPTETRQVHGITSAEVNEMTPLPHGLGLRLTPKTKFPGRQDRPDQERGSGLAPRTPLGKELEEGPGTGTVREPDADPGKAGSDRSIQPLRARLGRAHHPRLPEHLAPQDCRPLQNQSHRLQRDPGWHFKFQRSPFEERLVPGFIGATFPHPLADPTRILPIQHPPHRFGDRSLSRMMDRHAHPRRRLHHGPVGPEGPHHGQDSQQFEEAAQHRRQARRVTRTSQTIGQTCSSNSRLLDLGGTPDFIPRHHPPQEQSRLIRLLPVARQLRPTRL